MPAATASHSRWPLSVVAAAEQDSPQSLLLLWPLRQRSAAMGREFRRSIRSDDVSHPRMVPLLAQQSLAVAVFIGSVVLAQGLLMTDRYWPDDWLRPWMLLGGNCVILTRLSEVLRSLYLAVKHDYRREAIDLQAALIGELAQASVSEAHDNAGIGCALAWVPA